MVFQYVALVGVIKNYIADGTLNTVRVWVEGKKNIYPPDCTYALKFVCNFFLFFMAEHVLNVFAF